MSKLEVLHLSSKIYDVDDIDIIKDNCISSMKNNISSNNIVKQQCTPSDINVHPTTLSSANRQTYQKQHFQEYNSGIGGYMNQNLFISELSVKFDDPSKDYKFYQIEPKFKLEINGQLANEDDPIEKRTFKINFLNGTSKTYVGHEEYDKIMFNNVSSYERNGQISSVEIGKDYVEYFDAMKQLKLSVNMSVDTLSGLYQYVFDVYHRDGTTSHKIIYDPVEDDIVFSNVSAYKYNDGDVIKLTGTINYTFNGQLVSSEISNRVFFYWHNDVTKPYDSEEKCTYHLTSFNGSTQKVNIFWRNKIPMIIPNVRQISNDGEIYVMKYHEDKTFTNNIMCLLKGTRITLFDGSFKNIEDISYDDNLLTFNFDTGEMEAAKPLWIKKSEIGDFYYENTFDTGRKLFTTGPYGHRVFDPKRCGFVYDTESVGRNVMTLNGTNKLISCEKRENSPCEFYNIITFGNMNMFANDILTSCRYNNLYKIKNMRYVKDGRELIPVEEFDGIPQKYIDGMRLRETSNFDINETREYVNMLIEKEVG